MTTTTSRRVGEDETAGGGSHDARGRADRAAKTPTYPEWFARTWSGTAGTGPARCPYDDPSRRLADAVVEAAVRFPGPIGELIRRELRAFADFGYRFDGSGLVPRLVEELLGGRRTPDCPLSARAPGR
jgi:hypothetical protein